MFKFLSSLICKEFSSLITKHFFPTHKILLLYLVLIRYICSVAAVGDHLLVRINWMMRNLKLFIIFIPKAFSLQLLFFVLCSTPRLHVLSVWIIICKVCIANLRKKINKLKSLSKVSKKHKTELKRRCFHSRDKSRKKIRCDELLLSGLMFWAWNYFVNISTLFVRCRQMQLLRFARLCKLKNRNKVDDALRESRNLINSR